MTQSVADDADLTPATLGYRLTDSKTHAGTLDKLVEFDEALKNRRLLVDRNTLTRVLTIEVDTVLVVWSFGRLVVLVVCKFVSL